MPYYYDKGIAMPRNIGIIITMAALLTTDPVIASDIGKVLIEKPELTLTSTMPMFDIERCLVYADLPYTPAVYRAPDRPNESLLYNPDPVVTPPLIRLRQAGGTTTIDVWHAQLSKQARAVRKCVAQAD